jgi:hypothetical protein
MKLKLTNIFVIFFSAIMQIFQMGLIVLCAKALFKPLYVLTLQCSFDFQELIGF